MSLIEEIKTVQQEIIKIQQEIKKLTFDFNDSELIKETLKNIGNIKDTSNEELFNLKKNKFDKFFIKNKNSYLQQNRVNSEKNLELKELLKELLSKLLNISSKMTNCLKIIDQEILFEILYLVDIKKLIIMSPNTIRYLKKDAIFDNNHYVKKCKFEIKKRIKLFIANKFKIALMMDIYGSNSYIDADIIKKYYETLSNTSLNKKLILGKVRFNKKSKSKIRIKNKKRRVYLANLDKM
ncbi:hypothetical protein DMUE_4675 [Dictyocoela muelleri]|nr:hypothetical protein DMUE_4675 [Dictyocoela muelleri]